MAFAQGFYKYRFSQLQKSCISCQHDHTACLPSAGERPHRPGKTGQSRDSWVCAF